MCTCDPKPRVWKTSDARWLCSGCNEPHVAPITPVALVRTDAESGASIASNLSVFRRDLEDADTTAALEALVTDGEAATPHAWYELLEVAS